MHYESSAFANGKTAMTRKDGSKQFGNNRGFTKVIKIIIQSPDSLDSLVRSFVQHDVAKIRRLYRCR